MNPRILESFARSGRPQTRYCDALGCRQATREGKPYCSEHVEEHPYVQQLISLLSERDHEESRVRRQGPRAVDVSGLTAREILQFVKVHGQRTVQRLARELNIDFKTLEGYVKALKKSGLISTSQTRRGATVIKLNGVETALIDGDDANEEEAAVA